MQILVFKMHPVPAGDKLTPVKVSRIFFLCVVHFVLFLYFDGGVASVRKVGLFIYYYRRSLAECIMNILLARRPIYRSIEVANAEFDSIIAAPLR